MDDVDRRLVWQSVVGFCVTRQTEPYAAWTLLFIVPIVG